MTITVIIRKYQDPPPSALFRVCKRYGDEPVVLEANMDIKRQYPPPYTINEPSNFQNMDVIVKLEDGYMDMGGIHNTLFIPNADYLRLDRFQTADELGTVEDKLRWLSHTYRHSIYWTEQGGSYNAGDPLWWGCIALGGNVVQVIRTETVQLATYADSVARPREVAVLRGFTPADWMRPRQELVEQGLLHRCYCAYGIDNTFGDSPRGVVYSPFWHPHGDLFQTGWRLHGTKRLDAFRVPVEWLR